MGWLAPLWGADARFGGQFLRLTHGGGAANAGVVFKLDPAGNLTVLHAFTGGVDWGYPLAGLIVDSAGNLYGNTAGGGGAAQAGVVFKLDPSGNETVLYTFLGGTDGFSPNAGVTMDSANLYGTTYNGGTAGVGVVFKLDPAGNETVLHSFTGNEDGVWPETPLFLDPAGNLYGCAAGGQGATAWFICWIPRNTKPCSIRSMRMRMEQSCLAHSLAIPPATLTVPPRPVGKSRREGR